MITPKEDLISGIIREKLSQMTHALFYNLEDNRIPFGNKLVHYMGMDVDGKLLFCFKPSQMDELEKREPFGGRLLFFKKGLPYYIWTEGLTSILHRQGNLFLLHFQPSFVEVSKAKQTQHYFGLRRPSERFWNWIWLKNYKEYGY